MKYTRLSLYYLAGYLAVAGPGLLFAPETTLRLLFSNASYDDTFVRLCGGFFVALCTIVVRMIYLRVEVFYTTALYARASLLAVFAWLYFLTSDPFFITML